MSRESPPAPAACLRVLAARGYRTAVIPTAIYHDGYVYATAGYGAGCDLIQLTKDGDEKKEKTPKAEGGAAAKGKKKKDKAAAASA